jgi:hypothetical protein
MQLNMIGQNGITAKKYTKKLIILLVLFLFLLSFTRCDLLADNTLSVVFERNRLKGLK